MEIHKSVWTILLEKVLGTDLMFYDHVVAAGFVFVILFIMAWMTKSKLSLIPGGFQQVMEVVVGGLAGMLEENIGKEGRKYIPLVGTLAFFIFMCNLLGMVPTFSAATGNLNTTVACAVIVFIYYNFEGVREHGVAYLKHFLGPMLPLAPIMLPIEIISHLARPFSLSVRLFGNISGEHIISAVFYGMVPFLLPVPLMAIGLFAAFLQTFVFIMLTMVYIAGSIAHDH